MSKDFKSTVDQTIAQKALKEASLKEEEKRLLAEKAKISEITEKFTDSYVVETITYKIKEQIAEDFRRELEDGLAIQIADSVREEITESVRQELKEQLDERVIDSNRQLVKVITLLSDKMEKINESLNIEVPTPIVHVNMPKITRKVNRNEDGTVNSITEEFDQSNEE